MTEETTAARLWRRARQVRAEELSERSVESASARLYDALGFMISGSSAPAFAMTKRYLGALGRIPQDFVDREGGPEDLFAPRSVEIDDESYGYLLGAPAFIENFGDTSLYSVTHPNTVIIPALLVAARRRELSGARALEAIVAGYQVMEYLARSLNNGLPRMAHQVRGFRPTASCGPAGVAATLALLAGVEDRIAIQAIGIACNLAAGLRRTDAGAAMHMRVHSGEAVRNGAAALGLAIAGIEVEARLIEGAGGFLQAMAGGELDAGAQEYLDEKGPLAIDDVALKLHATPHTLAPGLDCLLDLRREEHDLASSAREVRIYMARAHGAISLEAAATDPEELDEISALDHLPFCAAIALLSGEVIGTSSPGRFIGDRTALDLARRVRIVIDDQLSEMFDNEPGTWPSRVEVDLADRTLHAERRRPVGVEIDEVTRDALSAKFQANTAWALEADQRRAVLELTSALVDQRDLYGSIREAMGLS
jgi:2-methylcitrate dehydratase PrpD